MLYRVLVIARSFGAGSRKPSEILLKGGCYVKKNPFNRTLSEEELMELIRGFDAVIVGLDNISRRVIAVGRKLKVISKHGIGVDNIDLEAATERGIVVTNTQNVNSQAVADLTMGLIISMARQILWNNQYAKSREGTRTIGTDVHNKSLGIVGLGRIGQEVAKRAWGFEMRISYTDPFPKRDAEIRYKLISTDLNTLLKESDFVSLHVPLTVHTEGLIGEKELKLMKRNAYMINTSRSEIIDEKALYRALRDGEIAGAALDVYQENSSLLDLKNTVCLPHIGALTYETIEKMGVVSAENVVRVLNGQMPLCRVN